jgi:hypothetical protein
LINTHLNRINVYRVWLWLLFFSFAYEFPLVELTSFDRVNPRLFDIAMIFGIFLLFKSGKIVLNKIFKIWLWLIAWFTVCVIFGLFFYSYPLEINSYMVYFLIEYYKGVVVVLIFLSIPYKKYNFNDIIFPLVIGGIFVAIYSIFESSSATTEVLISGGKIVGKASYAIWGPFGGATYFELANFLPLVVGILYSMSLTKSGFQSLFLLTLTIFVSWPSLFSGSRTSLFLAILVVLLVSVQNIKKGLKGLSKLLLLLIVFELSANLFSNSSFGENEAIDRAQSFERSDTTASHNSIKDRFLQLTNFPLQRYDQDLTALFGAGFYVAPIDGRFRIGYGIHNIYLFPLEQAGIVAFLIFVYFLYSINKIFIESIKIMKSSFKEYYFIIAVKAYFYSMLVAGLFGSHIFWRGFNTNNHNTLKILLFVIIAMLVKNYTKKGTIKTLN